MGYTSNVIMSDIQQVASADGVLALESFLRPMFTEMGITTEVTDQTITLNGQATITITKASDDAHYYYIHDGRSACRTRYGAGTTSHIPVKAHAAVSKNRSILSVGLSLDSDDVPFFTLSIIKQDDAIMTIQHASIHSDVTHVYSAICDAFVLAGETKRTSPQFVLGYYSNDFLTLVPAVNPWTNKPITDLYWATIRPQDTSAVRTEIQINGRNFISGRLSNSEDFPSNSPLTFVEI